MVSVKFTNLNQSFNFLSAKYTRVQVLLYHSFCFEENKNEFKDYIHGIRKPNLSNLYIIDNSKPNSLHFDHVSASMYLWLN